MSRLFVIQVAGISNWEMIEKGENDLNMFLWRCHWQGNTSRLVLCLQIISQDCSSKEMGVVNLWERRAERRGKAPDVLTGSHAGGSAASSPQGQVWELPDSGSKPLWPVLASQLPSAGVGTWLDSRSRGQEPQAAGGGELSFLHLPHSSALCFGSMRSWGVPHCSRYVPPKCVTAGVLLWAESVGNWAGELDPSGAGGHCWLSSGSTQRKGLLGIVCKQFPGNSGSPALPVSDEKERGGGRIGERSRVQGSRRDGERKWGGGRGKDFYTLVWHLALAGIQGPPISEPMSI